ncbi:hypothetical protein BKN37_16585 [Mycobacterium talmoniae]|uniref:Uncharacterized protein n=1 Tax=Mycobacterium talmoniae TaxID=1858794 RepID=A0A1S1NJ01_9MYCO|nr:hypothetical protein BKN37_16585 [Mycobacterium talmoniae]
MSAVSDPYGGGFAGKLYPRYRGEYTDAALLDRQMNEDHVGPLISFLFIGLERRDLQPDEVAEAIELARDGKLLKSSAWLLEHLLAYQRDVLHVA